MPRKYLIGSVVALVLTLLVFAGCNQKAARTDAQIAGDVQSKIYGDAVIQSRSITVQTSNGIVTLNGDVTNDAERGAAANDAATVTGVRTVVNNLEVQQAQAAPPPTIAEQPAPVQHKPEPKRAAANTNRAKHEGAKHTASSENNSDEPLLARTAPPEQNAMAQPTPVAAQTPPPPQKVTIPAGTQLTIRLNDPLDSEKNQVGDAFHASLGAPIVIDDQTVIPTGADVTGRVAAVQSAGRFAGSSLLTLELTRGHLINTSSSK